MADVRRLFRRLDDDGDGLIGRKDFRVGYWSVNIMTICSVFHAHMRPMSLAMPFYLFGCPSANVENLLTKILNMPVWEGGKNEPPQGPSPSPSGVRNIPETKLVGSSNLFLPNATTQNRLLCTVLGSGLSQERNRRC